MTKYASLGDLGGIIKKLREDPQQITAKAAYIIMKQLLSGLMQIWMKQRVHTDIKPENILVDCPGFSFKDIETVG